MSEHAAPPVRVLVHDPSETRAFERLDEVPADELEERFLFRAHPAPDTFSREHASLVRTLREEGVEVVSLRTVVDRDGARQLDENPNHVYTRDSVITLPWLPGWFVRGSMRKPVRQSEPDVLAPALERLGLQELFATPAGQFLEGGDVIPLERDGRQALVVGFGPRSSRESLDELWARLSDRGLDEIVGLELAPERMNLDGVLVPVADDTVLVDPTSIVGSVLIDTEGERPVDVLALLREQGMEPLEVTRTEATTMQACNCVCLGDRRLIAYDLCARVVAELRARDFEVHTIPGSELIKGTGGPRCMTRPLYV